MPKVALNTPGNEHGKSMTLIRQTETDASMGDVTAVSEESWTIVTMMENDVEFKTWAKEQIKSILPLRK